MRVRNQGDYQFASLFIGWSTNSLFYNFFMYFEGLVSILCVFVISALLSQKFPNLAKQFVIDSSYDLIASRQLIRVLSFLAENLSKMVLQIYRQAFRVASIQSSFFFLLQVQISVMLRVSTKVKQRLTRKWVFFFRSNSQEGCMYASFSLLKNMLFMNSVEMVLFLLGICLFVSMFSLSSWSQFIVSMISSVFLQRPIISQDTKSLILVNSSFTFLSPIFSPSNFLKFQNILTTSSSQPYQNRFILRLILSILSGCTILLNSPIFSKQLQLILSETSKGQFSMPWREAI